MQVHTVHTERLTVGYVSAGPDDGWPVAVLHGFPYDVHAYDAVAPVLAAAGARVVVPYLRGFGATTFRSSTIPRSGQQGALGADLLALLDALHIRNATLAGYDWGGRAACVAAALFPQRVHGLVTVGGYNIHNIASADQPAAPEDEHRKWYQYYLHSERGRKALQQGRRQFCRYLWKQWSPTWNFTDKTFLQTAPAFFNTDFVDVVVHSYRARYGLAEPDPAYADLERQLANTPDITVPTIVFDCASDGVEPRNTTSEALTHFTGPAEYRLLPHTGHDTPQETPGAVIQAVLDLQHSTTSL